MGVMKIFPPDRRGIEPGVLSVFRTFIGVRLAMVGLALLGQILVRHWPGPMVLILFGAGMAEAALLLLYLSVGRLERRMKGYYLPVGIAWAALGPTLQTYLALWLLRNVTSENTLVVAAWQMIPVLFIPLVVTAWQYSFRQVILLCAATMLVDLLPLALLGAPESGLLRFAYPVFGVVFVRTVAFLFVGNMITGLMKVQRAQRRDLSDANARLAQYATTLEQLTLSRERNRVARELHDILAHTLSGVAVELEAVRALWQVDSDRAQSMLSHSLQATRDGLTETRRALQELRASPLEDLGLALAVRSLAESAAGRAGFRLDLHITEPLGDYPPAVQQCIYRVTQEALANAAAHSGAHCVSLTLNGSPERLRLEIQDDGRGFDPAALSEDQYGLRGMRERVEMICGQFEVHSQVGQGVKISLVYGEAQA
jgi:signal transduction histidine kinase